MSGSDEDAADVDADGRPAPRSKGVWRGHRPRCRPHRRAGRGRTR
jgi:hypothetical protein